MASVLEFAYAAAALAVGVFLYWRNPALYLGFAWWLWFLTPEVRRLVDYQLGWNSTSPIMLAPYLVTALAFFALLRHAPKLQFRRLLPFGLVLLGLSYGFIVGAFASGTYNAAFDLLNWSVPVALAFFVVVHWRDYPEYRRVIQRTFLWGVLIMGLYGLWQFISPPEWDRFWMTKVPMSSIGTPEPYKVRVFSTSNSPGTFAMVMMAGLLVLLSGSGLKRWVAASVGFTSFLLSLVRSAWGGWVVGLLFLAAHRGRSRPRLLAALVVIGLIAWPLLSIGPVADAIDTRLQTLGEIQQDTSFGERMEFYSEFAAQAFYNPLGEGLGSTGIATKLSSERGALGQYGNFDSGVMVIPFVLGWPGTLLYGGGLIWLSSYALRGTKRPDLFAAACRGIAAGALAQLLFGNVATGVSGVVLWSFLGLALAARVYHGQEAGATEQRSSFERPKTSLVTAGYQER